MRVIVLARSHILVAVLNAFYLTLSAPKVAGDVAPQMTDAVLPIGTMNCRVMHFCDAFYLALPPFKVAGDGAPQMTDSVLPIGIMLQPICECMLMHVLFITITVVVSA